MSPDPNDPEPVPPVPPYDGECCESGCGDQCVWTRYAEARRGFEAAHAAWAGRRRQPAPPEGAVHDHDA